MKSTISSEDGVLL